VYKRQPQTPNPKPQTPEKSYSLFSVKRSRQLNDWLWIIER
jgi:hypothetical protein